MSPEGTAHSAALRYKESLAESGALTGCWQCAQEKRSAYAPSEETPVRYDGIYRIARAYRKPGAQKQLVCRYLFVRCDNEPAPWSSEGKPSHPW